MQRRHDNIAREQRFCRHCPFHVGDEEHLNFDCPAFDFLREHHARLFEEQQTVCGVCEIGLAEGCVAFICACLNMTCCLPALLTLWRLIQAAAATAVAVAAVEAIAARDDGSSGNDYRTTVAPAV